MSNHALSTGPAAARPRLALGAAAVALLLLTAACTADDARNAACTAGATIDGWFGTTSAEREKDCGPAAGQSARYTGKPTRAEAPLTDTATVSDLQLRLKTLGYDPGPADGQLGPKTRAAIRAYQRDSGLKADGQVTASLLKRMKVERR